MKGFIALVALSLSWMLTVSVRGESPAGVEYGRDVKPLFHRCLACHGGLRQQSGLRLDTPAFMVRGGDSGPVIVPGKSAESLLVDAIAGLNGVSRMPPDGEGTRLTDNEIAKVRAWIDQGAQARDEPVPADPRQHWSFQKPARPSIPIPGDAHAAWVRNPVDAFVLAEQLPRGLSPAPEAGRATLLRRVTLDLTGLPPTREELDAFLSDISPDAYEKVVARLLASPRYGERWGRHWMDVWRYSDWAGYGQEIRESQYHIWRWRDWIIESLNADKPYDAMIVEMLAGDEIAPLDRDVLRATGYLGRSWYKFNRNVWLDNVVEHSSKAFVGLTMNCARCHDHKYDPISQSEYYQWRAFFEPYDTRYDRLPGESDVTKSGIARVFDKRINDKTFLLIRGNEQEPQKDHPLSPGLPELFSARMDLREIPLPVESFYPDLADFVVAETWAKGKADAAAAEAGETKAHAEREAAKKNWSEVSAVVSPGSADSGSASDDALQQRERSKKEAAEKLAACEAAWQLASAKKTAAVTALASYEARLAAERAKFGLEGSGDRTLLSVAAAKAERRAKIASLEFQILEARGQLADARAAEKPDDEKSKKAVTQAQSKLDEATKSLDAVLNAPETPPQYSPLGEIHPPTSTGRRLALARWIASTENPLTARVAVNHVWMRHFGTALVPTVFDFGTNGRKPTHPQLLDWLAVELMEHGWRMKHLHQLIVCSATYRQSSDEPDTPVGTENGSVGTSKFTAQRAVDPDNQFLWRMSPRRIEAEIVRDSVLFVAGSLDQAMGGPEIDQTKGQTVARRSVYFRHAKEKEMVFTKLFDGPGVVECYQREESIVPQQALALANSPLAKAHSRRLATRLSESCGRENAGADNERFISAAFLQMLTRPPTSRELEICLRFLKTQAELLADPARLTAATVGETASVPPANEPHLRARENLIHVLMNHTDFVTLR